MVLAQFASSIMGQAIDCVVACWSNRAACRLTHKAYLEAAEDCTHALCTMAKARGAHRRAPHLLPWPAPAFPRRLPPSLAFSRLPSHRLPPALTSSPAFAHTLSRLRSPSAGALRHRVP